MFQRLKLLRRLQEVGLENPEEALATLERVKTQTSSAADRERLAHLIRVTLEVTNHLRSAADGQHSPPRSARSSPTRQAKRKRQVAKVARRRQRR